MSSSPLVPSLSPSPAPRRQENGILSRMTTRQEERMMPTRTTVPAGAHPPPAAGRRPPRRAGRGVATDVVWPRRSPTAPSQLLRGPRRLPRRGGEGLAAGHRRCAAGDTSGDDPAWRFAVASTRCYAAVATRCRGRLLLWLSESPVSPLTEIDRHHGGPGGRLAAAAFTRDPVTLTSSAAPMSASAGSVPVTRWTSRPPSSPACSSRRAGPAEAAKGRPSGRSTGLRRSILAGMSENLRHYTSAVYAFDHAEDGQADGVQPQGAVRGLDGKDVYEHGIGNPAMIKASPPRARPEVVAEAGQDRWARIKMRDQTLARWTTRTCPVRPTSRSARLDADGQPGRLHGRRLAVHVWDLACTARWTSGWTRRW